jgi:hypothetical protein
MRNNTKRDPGEMRVDGVEWMKLAGGTVSALIDTIMNLRGFTKCWKYFY